VKILAFDTSTFAASAAVVDGGTVLAESSVLQRAGHSERLLPLVDEVLARAGLPLGAIDRLAVGLGPGSFTGVRLGLATAKGLQLATGIPLVGVSSLDALAASAWGVEGPLVAALDARRDEVYAALFRQREGDREAVGAEAFRGGGVTIVGDLDDGLFARLSRAAAGPLRRAPRVVGTPLARWVAAEVLAGRGRPDAGGLEPTYLRGADAKLPGAGSP
jgi:tRNA threonylcarbamoyladenosine biosynthesis protein TsaB